MELAGQPLCGWCRDLRLRELQRPAHGSGRSAVDPRQVILWARVFDGVMLAAGIGSALVTGGYMVFMGTMMQSMAPPRAAPPPPLFFQAFTALGIGTAVLTLLVALVAYLPPLLGPGRGRGWLWTWQTVALAFGMAMGAGTCGVFLLAPAVILLLYWVKPEVRAYCEERARA